MENRLTIEEKLRTLSRGDYAQFFGISLKVAGQYMDDDRQYFQCKRITVSMFIVRYSLAESDVYSLFPYRKVIKV